MDREAYLYITADRNGQISFKESVLEKPERTDNWGNVVEFRTNSAVTDLRAADARCQFSSNYPQFIYSDRAWSSCRRTGETTSL